MASPAGAVPIFLDMPPVKDPCYVCGGSCTNHRPTKWCEKPVVPRELAIASKMARAARRKG